MSLSDVQCKTAKPREKKYKMFDGEGLYLEVYYSSDSRYWRLKYQVGEKEKRFAIGVYASCKSDFQLLRECHLLFEEKRTRFLYMHLKKYIIYSQ